MKAVRPAPKYNAKIQKMILQDTIDKINSQLATTNLFGKSWGLCELITDGTITMPAFYLGNSNYGKNVVNWTKFIGVSYIRRNGKVAFEEISRDEQLVDCDTATQMTVPLKIVCIVPKKELPQDNEFADDFVANKITAALNGVKDFITDANSSFLFVQEYETDNQVIIDEEFTGIKLIDVHYKYSYLSLSVIARIVIDSACLEPSCEPCY